MQIYSIFCYFQKKRLEYLCVTRKKCFFAGVLRFFSNAQRVDICQKKITASMKKLFSYNVSFKMR